ncbi:outer membrane protein OmpA-like peptidoglycan-associated protein [Neisseria sp. HSC-16F19]|nr:OmpA family protein [Neisseria sp. HSC-16F19]MCP2040076.1 outer membrane protein OmpA-like peptidoglycan-associated protein [Neisseria sp. HSC-16F19]
MYQEDEDNSQRIGLWAVGAVTAAVVIGVLGFSVWGNSGSAAETAQAPAQQVVLTGGDQVVVENGVVKFYFATGSSNLAEGANEALADVVAGVADGKKAVISGFHDSTGNAEINAEVSKNRALAVRDALIALGVAEDSIELRKPEVTEGSGDNAEARRVEVVLE